MDHVNAFGITTKFSDLIIFMKPVLDIIYRLGHCGLYSICWGSMGSVFYKLSLIRFFHLDTY